MPFPYYTKQTTIFQGLLYMNINFARLTIAGESNTGPIRHHNEDNILIYAPPGGSAVLAAVADGIGGHSRGEIASRICCRELLRKAMKCDCAAWDGDFLNRSLQQINREMFDFNFRSFRLRPMGCTVAAAVFTADKVTFASAGDSRIYEFCRNGEGQPLHQLTTDHRPEGYAELLSTGKIRHLSLVSRSLGTAKHLEVDIREKSRPANAVYMLCSDGLYNRLPSQVISGILGSPLAPRKMVGILVREAMLAGEKDNISVICAAPAGKEVQ